MPEQIQPVPDIPVRVNPAGGISVTVTGPVVTGPPTKLFTVTVYTAAICPGAKAPLWVIRMPRPVAAKLAVIVVATLTTRLCVGVVIPLLQTVNRYCCPLIACEFGFTESRCVTPGTTGIATF